MDLLCIMSRKIFFKFMEEKGRDKWTWTRAAVMKVGPDAKQHLDALPWRARPERVLKMFAPLHPTRFSMWGCLMGIAFKQVPGALEAWKSGSVTAEVFKRHAEIQTTKWKCTPHLKFLWDSIVQEVGT